MVRPKGKWYLFVHFGNWSVKTKYYTASRSATGSTENDKALGQLDGQKLLKVSYTPDRVCHFEFDLGGVLQIGPYDSELTEEEKDVSEWALFYEDRSSVSLKNDQTFSFEPAPDPAPGKKAD
jgi:hypothetical protein